MRERESAALPKIELVASYNGFYGNYQLSWPLRSAYMYMYRGTSLPV